MPDTRLIERWLPIAALGEESTRERRSMTALPPPTISTSGGRAGRWWPHGRLFWLPCCQPTPTGRNSCMCSEFMGIRWLRDGELMLLVVEVNDLRKGLQLSSCVRLRSRSG